MQSEAVILGTFAVCVFLLLSNFHICGMLGDMFSSMLLGQCSGASDTWRLSFYF